MKILYFCVFSNDILIMDQQEKFCSGKNSFFCEGSGKSIDIKKHKTINHRRI